MAPTIHDVAARIGVSVTTVSHVMNGKGRVSARTRARVLQAAREVRYSPNPHARSLATGRSMVLALQVSGYGPGTFVPSSVYFHQLLNSASAAALELGSTLVLAPPDAGEQELRRIPADGAIIVDPVGEGVLARLMRERGAPVVTTGRVTGSDDGSLWVDNDHFATTTAILDHLEAAGYTRPALIVTGRKLSYALDVMRAYRAWTCSRRLGPWITKVSDMSVDAAERAAQRLLRQQEIDAIFATTDDKALGVLLAAHTLERRIPDELGLFAGIDAPALRSTSPPVSAVDIHPGRIGREAVRLLIRLIDGDGSTELGSVTIPARLVARHSTLGPVAPGAPKTRPLEKAND